MALKRVKNITKKGVKGMSKMTQVLPLALKALVFMVVRLPKMIFDFTKQQMNFVKKAVPIAFAVIFMYIFVFFGMQYLLTELTGMSGLIPHLPLAIFSLLIVQQLVLGSHTFMRYVQKYLLILFLMIFDNPIIRDLVGFNVKIDKNKPMKSFGKIAVWSSKNILSVILVLFGLGFLTKITVRKILEYITFYTS